MDVSLFVARSDGASQEIVVRRNRIIVGREKGVELRVPARSVSRKHCEIVIEDDKVLVRDLGSSNGTFVNRERVEQSELNAGDLISVGPAVFAVKVDGEPAELEPEDIHARGSVELEDDAAAKAAYPGGAAAAAAALAGGSGDPDDSADALGALTGGSSDDSSLLDFDFDLGDDDDDDQPEL